ncbi:MAG: preprotein translocase subunit SecE [Solirubrobacteraceae bacterium]|nr:preprotein translocase subunit SecE [Solirubrobacteraceae bacterium]
MARNRKRAKERRARRPQGASVAASARLDRDAAPDPIEHASPDVDLAEAQLALGRPELSENAEDAAVDEAELELEAGQALAGDAGEDPVDAEEDAAVTESSKAVAGRRPHAGSRLVTFVQGSWRELQRVQWPDRRQVMQATGVVIGFVIVAGAFLGIADFLAGKVMNYILTGNFK